MAGQISNIKRQLKSVKATQKITNAMALVSTAKLQKQKSIMQENMIYAKEYEKMIARVLSVKVDKETNPYLINNNVNNPLHIVLSSNSGLCGSYNIELLKYVETTISKDDPIFAIGSYGIKWLDANDYMVIKRFTDLEEAKPSIVSELIYDALELYKNNEISKIDIIYTEYVNSLTFVPSKYDLLPLDIDEKVVEDDRLELAPDRDTVLEYLINQYVSACIYDTFLEAKASEHAARRSAMDNANRNAQNLIDEITLSFNQARQAAVTQEVNEITAGADAI